MKKISRGSMALRVARLRSKSTRPTSEVGMCKREVHECYAIPSNGDRTAALAWHRTPTQHPETDPTKIPRGVPVYWTGGSSGAGHVAISTGFGRCWSTDILRPGYFDRVPIAEVAKRWPSLTLVGWSEHVEGVRILDQKAS